MKSIVVVDKNWGIGKNNGLLFKLRLDMAFFRQKTTGKVVVMGSNNLKSLPDGKPLKNRTNIVLYPGGPKRDDCIVVESLQQLSNVLKNYNTDDVFVIGGAMLYATMVDYCDEAFVTKVDSNGDAEVFYPNLDQKQGWKLASSEPYVQDGDYMISFCRYTNDNPKSF